MMITLTQEMVDSLKSDRGGFTDATLVHFGFSNRTLVAGWKRRMVGHQMTQEAYDAALAGRLIKRPKPDRIYTKRKLSKRARSSIKRAQKRSLKMLPETSKEAEYTREKYLALLESQAWRQMRVAALLSGGRKCCLCGEMDGVLQVDHIVPASVDWSRRLDFSNLQVLCRPCNLGKGNRYTEDWRR